MYFETLVFCLIKKIMVKTSRNTHDVFPLPVAPSMALTPGLNIPLKISKELLAN